MELKEIEIDKIKVLENLRTHISDVSELMNSIKHQGLLEPIGVWKEGDNYIMSYGSRRLEAHKKLGFRTIKALVSDEPLSETEFMIVNTVENIQREDIQPIELGRICKRLRDNGLTKSEIASRLSIPKSRVNSTIALFMNVPDKFRDAIGFMRGTESKKGKLSATSTEKVLSSHLSTEKKEAILDIAKREEFDIRRIDLLINLLYQGMKFDKAVQKLDEYRVFNPRLVVKKSVEKELKKKYRTPITNIIIGMIRGKIEPDKRLVFKKAFTQKELMNV